MPFRKAHSCAGQAVSFALSNNKEIHELTLKELKTFSSLVRKEIFDILTPEQMVNRRETDGGTATGKVMAAIKAAEKKLKEELAEIDK